MLAGNVDRINLVGFFIIKALAAVSLDRIDSEPDI